MMMMMHHRQHPTVEVPPWDPSYDDPTVGIFSPQTNDYFTALQRYLPSSNEFTDDSDDAEFDSFSCDEFRMYEFKVRKCARGRSHDWTECPYAHPGEKARRRDPRRNHYSGDPCPEFRRGSCRKGDSCEFAHGVFECWLHPARYRTQPCKDGHHCTRRVCFFAHAPEQLRVVAESPRGRIAAVDLDSPPMSPPSYGGNSVGELVGVMRGLQIGKTGGGATTESMGSSDLAGLGTITCKILPPPLAGGGLSMSPRSPWGVQMGGSGSGFGSPRSPTGYGSGFCGSLPSTPTRTPTRSGLGLFDPWDLSIAEEPEMERVESGKDIRAKMYAKLSKENSLDGDRVNSASPGPDFGWVSELVK